MLAPIVAEKGVKALECPKCRKVCEVARGQASSLPMVYDIFGA
jgi:hypothetical protein